MGMVNIPYSPAKHRYVENGAIVPNEYLFVTQIIPHKTGQETPVKFRFHVMVNGGNYKAYLIELPNQHYERAKSYNYTVQVNVGGIFLTGWSINEWDHTIPGSN